MSLLSDRNRRKKPKQYSTKEDRPKGKMMMKKTIVSMPNKKTKKKKKKGDHWQGNSYYGYPSPDPASKYRIKKTKRKRS